MKSALKLYYRLRDNKDLDIILKTPVECAKVISAHMRTEYKDNPVYIITPVYLTKKEYKKTRGW